VHWGRVITRRGNAFGLTVSVAARITAAALPGQILISDVAGRRVPGAESWPAQAMSLAGVPLPVVVRSVALHPV
jgi:class 3 adenylate cyclase